MTSFTTQDWKQRSKNPSALDGTYYFYAGFSKRAELIQDIRIPNDIERENLQVELLAFMRSYKEGDESQLVLEIYNEETPLTFFDSGRMEYKEAWTEVRL